MRVTSILRQAVAAATAQAQTQARRPLIQFLGKRTAPKSVDHTSHIHPAAPSEALPDSFVSYRSKAQQHGPLTYRSSPISSLAGGAIGGHAGKSLGSVQPTRGEYFDRSELPSRFRRLGWTQVEIEAVETGGASLFA
ncbi:MAG: hypothetical protein M1823_006109 [Watsoniomyces obsoletus]|nr:MAG: hypothetical protein M1823_006109 [Watsoniomyces obsoletus]